MNRIRSFDAPALHPLVTVLLLTIAASCGERVSLGGDAIDPPMTDLDGGPPKTLYQFNEHVSLCHDVAVDDTYVYFSASTDQGPALYRCDKVACAATLTRIAEGSCDNCPYAPIQVAGKQLGLVYGFSTLPAQLIGPARIDTCTRPDCSDLRTVVNRFPSTSGVVFEEGEVDWIVLADRTIYRCDYPDCVDGPRVFGIGGSGMQMLTATNDWLYWLDTGQVMRKRKDGASPSERLELGAALGTVADGGVVSSSVAAIQADGSWLYALSSGDRTEAGTTCKLAVGPCAIARWPENDGGARQVVVTSDVGIDFMSNGIRVLQGELAFTTDQTYTCDADACGATVRPIGRADPGRMASDHDYLYWCTDEQSPLFASLQRVARVRR